MMRGRAAPVALAALSAIALLPACTATRLEAKAQLPPPLIEKLPVRVGVHFPREFREFVHKETRSNIDYEVTLGPAHVTNLDWLLKAMFADVVPLEDPKRVTSVKPPLVFVLEPKFEEFSFLTPKDVAGEAFIVTIRYLLNLYDASGARVDSFTYTGYGRERARTLAGKEPLQVATQRAMRDAGAKVAVELADQDSVRLLIRNASLPPGSPPPTVPATAPASPDAQPSPEAAPTRPDEEKPPAEERPMDESPGGVPPAEVPPVEEPPDEEPPAEPPPVKEPPAEEPPAEEPPAETPPVELPPTPAGTEDAPAETQPEAPAGPPPSVAYR
jgi:hypothetical protein